MAKRKCLSEIQASRFSKKACIKSPHAYSPSPSLKSRISELKSVHINGNATLKETPHESENSIPKETHDPLKTDDSSEKNPFEYGDPIHTERPLRIIVIGAGPSGLLFAYKLQRSFRNFSLTVFDKNPEVSGTWYENRYPGCACDIPAHNYTYTFEPKNDWSSTYAGAGEIKSYFSDFCAKYSLQKYVKLRHQVVAARWVETEGEWNVKVEDLQSGEKSTHTCNILINAGGYLNNPAWPDVPGLDQYQGKLLHSADWDESYSLEGKTVALMGNGSSGVQILPAIQPLVRHMKFFMRSSTWIIPPVGRGQVTYSQEELKQLEDPDTLRALRKANEGIVNSFFSLYLHGSPLQKEVAADFREAMRKRIPSHLSEEKMIPDWGVGCRRLTTGSDYLEALSKPNVTTILGGVTAMTKDGCTDAFGTTHPVDAIICATGFNTSYIPRFPILGTHNLNLQDSWAVRPRSYLGIAADNFPNFFTLLGPYSPIANGPTIPGLEAQCDHIMTWIDRYQTENIHSFVPKSEAVDDFLTHHASFMQKTVWAHHCRSGYKQHTTGFSEKAEMTRTDELALPSKVPQMWCGSSLHCREALQTVRADDWEVKYRGNRFRWLGNGISQTEMDPVSDLGWYLTDHDEGPWQSMWRRREVETRSGLVSERELFKIQRKKAAV